MRGWRLNGERLARLRDMRGLTQEQLSNVAGYSERTIRRAENGGPVSWKLLVDLSESLGVQQADLLHDSETDEFTDKAQRNATAFSESLTKGDVWSIGDLLDDEVVLFWSGPKFLPYTGIHNGKSAVLNAIDSRYQSVRFARPPKYECVISKCDHAVVAGTEFLSATHNNDSKEIEICFLLDRKVGNTAPRIHNTRRNDRISRTTINTTKTSRNSSRNLTQK